MMVQGDSDPEGHFHQGDSFSFPHRNECHRTVPGLTGLCDENSLITDGKPFPTSEASLHRLKDFSDIGKRFLLSEISFQQ
jgi:hypothetical protein